MNKQVTRRQLELLLDFMQEHRSLALGHQVRGKEGSVLSQRLWGQLTKVLNSQAGARKTYKDWKKYYNQYKCRVKAKVRTIKDNTGSGERPATETLFPLEERLCNILEDYGAPLISPIVKCDPIDTSEYDGVDAESHVSNTSEEEQKLSDVDKCRIEQKITEMERSRIEVDRQTARAVERTATALEGLVEQARRFVDIYERIHTERT